MTIPDQPSPSPAPPKPSSDVLCLVLVIVLGPLAWIIPARMSGKLEAWDGHFWWLWVAATALASLLLGYLGPRRWWLWPLLLPLSQFVTMIVQSPSVGPLAPLGLCQMVGIAGVFFMLPAYLGAKARLLT
jgi:hypothetical protein